MSRPLAAIAFAASLSLTACAISGPPLMEEDGQSRAAADRQRQAQRDKAEQARRAREARAYSAPRPQESVTSPGTSQTAFGGSPIEDAPRPGTLAGAEGQTPVPGVEDPYFAQDPLDAPRTVPVGGYGYEAPAASGAPVGLRDLDQRPQAAAPVRRLDEADLGGVNAAPSQPQTATQALPQPLPQPLPQATAASAGVRPAYLADPDAALLAVNAYRAEFGYAPLRFSPQLSATALAHARDLAARGEVTSLSAGGQGVISRITAGGYAPAEAASLVAGGYDSFDAALASWKENRVQRSRLLLPNATEVGVARVEDPRSTYRYYIEMIVAAP